MNELLVVDQLKKHFPVTKGLLFTKVVGWVKAVDGVSFTVEEGETFSLVGSRVVARRPRPKWSCAWNNRLLVRCGLRTTISPRSLARGCAHIAPLCRRCFKIHTARSTRACASARSSASRW